MEKLSVPGIYLLIRGTAATGGSAGGHPSGSPNRMTILTIGFCGVDAVVSAGFIVVDAYIHAQWARRREDVSIHPRLSGGHRAYRSAPFRQSRTARLLPCPEDHHLRSAKQIIRCWLGQDPDGDSGFDGAMFTATRSAAMHPGKRVTAGFVSNASSNGCPMDEARRNGAGLHLRGLGAAPARRTTRPLWR